MIKKSLLSNPRLRFLTIAEMKEKFGEAWMDNNPLLDTNDMLVIASHYAGKAIYPSMVHETSLQGKHFRYGPTQSLCNENLITTKSLPKYDINGNVITPGNIVRIEYIPLFQGERFVVPDDLRNEPGTAVRVLKVIKPSDYLVDHCGLKTELIDRYCVATELRNPASGGFIDILASTYSSLFKDGVVRAFEISHKVIKSSSYERKVYYHLIPRG